MTHRMKLSERKLPCYSKAEETMNMVSHIVGGALGMIYSFFAFIRNLMIYKNYEDIFTEAERRKVGEKID